MAGHADPTFILVSRTGSDITLFYGPNLATTPRLAGYVQANNSPYCDVQGVTYNGIDLSPASGPQPIYLYASATSFGPPLLAGTLRYRDVTYQISGGSIPGSTYDVLAPANIATIAGNWAMTNESGDATVLSIHADGTLSGTDRGCPLTGTVAPSKPVTGYLRATNMFDVAFTFAPCALLSPMRPVVNATYFGYVLAMPLLSGETQLLMWSQGITETWDGDYVLAIGRH